MTNYEKIKQMSVDEMAKQLTNCANNCIYYKTGECTIAQKVDCITGVRLWLESEVEE